MKKKSDNFTQKKLLQINKKIAGKKILFITGVNVFKKLQLKRRLKILLESPNTEVFKKKFYLPEIKELKKIIKIINKFNPKIIYAIGGGGVLDLAKISNLFKSEKNLEKKIKKNIIDISLKKNLRSLVAIPTTAGSGAEVTSNAVIYINKKKYSVENKFVKPSNYLLMPEFVEKSSFNLKSSAGFDAIAQGIESMFSLKSNNESLNYAIKSVKLSFKHYQNFLNNKNLSDTCRGMMLAANLSGKAINISKTIAPHAISYPFTSHFGISHGLAVALNFEEIIEYLYKNKNTSISKFNLDDRFKILFKLSETNNFSEFKKFIKYLKKSGKVKDTFESNNINISQNIDLILKNVNVQRLKNNPIALDFESLKKILLNKK